MVTLGTSQNYRNRFVFISSWLNPTFHIDRRDTGLTHPKLGPRVWRRACVLQLRSHEASLVFPGDRWCAQWGRNQADVSSYLQVVGERHKACAPGKQKSIHFQIPASLHGAKGHISNVLWCVEFWRAMESVVPSWFHACLIHHELCEGLYWGEGTWVFVKSCRKPLSFCTESF